eukprot:11325918-Alexandrium_andersonii.AAC.1
MSGADESDADATPVITPVASPPPPHPCHHPIMPDRMLCMRVALESSIAATWLLVVHRFSARFRLCGVGGGDASTCKRVSSRFLLADSTRRRRQWWWYSWQLAGRQAE